MSQKKSESSYRCLMRVICFKIICTAALWSLPLMFFPASLLRWFGLPDQISLIFVRLLGWAYFALLINYIFGRRSMQRGEDATGPIIVGIVSNGSACGVLLWYGVNGTWLSWRPVLNIYLWISAVLTFLITLGLAWGLAKYRRTEINERNLTLPP